MASPTNDSPWSARFETAIPPDRAYVPRAHLMHDAAQAASAAGLPAGAVAVAALQVEGVRDDERARGWPFVDRHLVLTLVADRPGGASRLDSSPVGALGWRRVPWSPDEAAAWAREVGTDAEAVMDGSDYDQAMWGTRMAVYMVALREHAKGQRPRPERPAALGAKPHGRTVIVGWLGSPAVPEVSDALALHLGVWSQAHGGSVDCA